MSSKLTIHDLLLMDDDQLRRQMALDIHRIAVALEHLGCERR